MDAPGLRPTTAAMTQQIVPGPRYPGVVFTGQLTGAGAVVNSTEQPGLAYASVSQTSEVRSSPYVPAVACKCGVRNPDNTCVVGTTETMPFEATTPAQHAYLASLWDTKPYMPLYAADAATMLRAAPTALRPQTQGPLY